MVAVRQGNVCRLAHQRIPPACRSSLNNISIAKVKGRNMHMPRALAALFASVAMIPIGSLAVRAADPAPGSSKPIKAMLVIGGCCHDYESQKKLLTEGISAR